MPAASTSGTSSTAPAELTLFDLPIAPNGFGVVLPPARLRSINFSALDFETARRSIIEYVKTYYPDQFNDFVASNGFIMMVEIVAATTAKLSMRSDIVANEAFLPTAQTQEAVVNHLALINQTMLRQTPAIVDIQCSMANQVITDVHIPAGTQFSVRTGSAIFYELFRAPGDFTSDIVIPGGKLGVIAVGIQGRTVGPVSFNSGGGPSQQYTISDSTALSSPITVTLITGNDSEDWLPVTDAIQRYGPLDKVVQVLFIADKMILQFGNDVTGAAPVAGQVIQVTYRTGGGVAGRIAAGQINESRQLTPDAPANAPVQVNFRNTGTSTGGTDAETIQQAKVRAPANYSMRTGIVTAEDYANAAANFAHPVYGSVAKAVATIRTGLNANLVEIYCLALGSDGRPTAPNVGLKNGLQTYYEQLNVLTDSVSILDGQILAVDLTMLVVISRSVDANLVKTNVDQAIANYFDIANWSMGQPLYTSNIIEAVSSIDGVQYVDLFSPSQNILAGVTGGVQFNQLIVLGQYQAQYYYQKPEWQQ